MRELHPLQKLEINGGYIMEANERYLKIWKLLNRLAHGYLERRFGFEHETLNPEGPCLIVTNHVTNWDPLLLAISFPNRHIHFVASEHLFRMGWKSKLINYLVAPIPRRKGANGAATALDCLRKMRAGGAICIFGEGETTWDGRSGKVFPATGTLAKLSGASLITYRFEGAYLTAPRWGDSVRKGKMRGRMVRTYAPEQLKAMTPQQIEDAMNADIYEDAWARQSLEKVRFKGGNRTKHIETALFMCPKCKSVGTLLGKGNAVTCSCGLHVSMNEYGTFDSPAPFENIAQWDEWQHARLLDEDFAHEGAYFSEAEVTLAQLDQAGAETVLLTGELSIDRAALSIGERSFPLAEIDDMALIQRRKLAFMHSNMYYELQTPEPRCLRKYYAAWKNAAARAKNA